MFFSKQEILNLFNAYATQMIFFFIIASFISLIMYIFLKRKILFKVFIYSNILSVVITSSYIYFNQIDLLFFNKMARYDYNKMAEEIKNKKENEKYPAFRKFIYELKTNRTLTQADIETLTLMDKSEFFKTDLEIEVQAKKDVEMILKAMSENK